MTLCNLTEVWVDALSWWLSASSSDSRCKLWITKELCSSPFRSIEHFFGASSSLFRRNDVESPSDYGTSRDQRSSLYSIFKITVGMSIQKKKSYHQPTLQFCHFAQFRGHDLFIHGQNKTSRIRSKFWQWVLPDSKFLLR